MTAVAANPPIPGERNDPPPIEVPELIQDLDDSDSAAAVTVGVAYRAMTRFNTARSTILAAGTTYYSFLSLFSLIALAYGITAIFGADEFATWLTKAISEAFPGLLGENGIDPGELRAVGQAASLLGLLVMLYAGSGAMIAANSSIHLIYGAPPDPRKYFLKRVRLLGLLLVIGPLIAFSFVAGGLLHSVSRDIFEALGISASTDQFLLNSLALALTLAADILVVHILLARLGGIRPSRRSLIVGATVGAVVLQLIRIPMGLILEFSLDKPQYGALAIPIGILLVLYFNAITIYGCAALTAGIAERDLPIDEITPAVPIDETQIDVNTIDPGDQGEEPG